MSNEFDIEQLYQALDEQRVRQGLTWAGVAKEIEQRFVKVSAATIKGIRDKQNVEGDGALQMMLWLGRPPESFVAGLEVDERHQLPVPDGAVLRFDLKHIYQLLDTRREQKGLTWDEVAAEVGGYSAGSLKRYRKGGRTSFPGVMRIARWLGVPAKDLTIAFPW